jgi:uncharacterized protein
MIDNLIISELVNKIAKGINPDKIYLFGSYAKGEANEDSDLDFLIIKDTHEPRHKRSVEVQRLLIGTKIPADIIVYTNQEFEKEKHNNLSFINSVIQGAQLMYERE